MCTIYMLLETISALNLNMLREPNKLMEGIEIGVSLFLLQYENIVELVT